MSFSFSDLEPGNYVMEKHITVQTASKVSGYSIQYLRRLLRASTLCGTKIGHVRLIVLASLESYLEVNLTSDDRRFGPHRLQR